jgi:hypothetical protein
MGPYAGIDYNLTLSPLQSRLQHIYHGQPYARVYLNPMPELALTPSQGLWIWPQLAFSQWPCWGGAGGGNVTRLEGGRKSEMGQGVQSRPKQARPKIPS